MVRLGCSTASFPADRLEIAITKAAWAGYQGVELCCPGEPPAEAELQQRLRLEGVEVFAGHAGTLPLGTADLSTVDALGRVGRAAAFVRGLDCGMVVLHAPEEGSSQQAAASLNLLDLALGGLAVDLCLVNRRGTLLETPEQFAELWRLGLPERVGIALDPGQAFLSGWDPLQWEQLPELPRHLYLTDAGVSGPVPVGSGRLDLDALGAVFAKHGYAAAAVVALENADPWAVEPITKEIREAAEAALRR
jgi:sugar phosphate isomerase/epimerase